MLPLVSGEIPTTDLLAPDYDPTAPRLEPDDDPTTDPPEAEQGPPIVPRRWVTRAHELEPLLSLGDQAKIRHKLKMDPDEDVTFQTIIELGPDAFEPLWNAHRPPLGPPNG